MASPDKTKSQLIDSMRMSKGGVSETPTKEVASKSATVKKKASKAKRAPVKAAAAAKKPVAKKAVAAAAPGRVSIASDDYESGMRIWPD
jgi:hypothetical protein